MLREVEPGLDLERAALLMAYVELRHELERERRVLARLEDEVLDTWPNVSLDQLYHALEEPCGRVARLERVGA